MTNNTPSPSEHEQALHNLTLSMKIACCKSCLLAHAMRDCPTCLFNIGLTAKIDTESTGCQVLDTHPVIIPV